MKRSSTARPGARNASAGEKPGRSARNDNVRVKKGRGGAASLELFKRAKLEIEIEKQDTA